MSNDGAISMSYDGSMMAVGADGLIDLCGDCCEPCVSRNLTQPQAVISVDGECPQQSICGAFAGVYSGGGDPYVNGPVYPTPGQIMANPTAYTECGFQWSVVINDIARYLVLYRQYRGDGAPKWRAELRTWEFVYFVLDPLPAGSVTWGDGSITAASFDLPGRLQTWGNHDCRGCTAHVTIG
jgi:hypothetical protein